MHGTDIYMGGTDILYTKVIILLGENKFGYKGQCRARASVACCSSQLCCIELVPVIKSLEEVFAGEVDPNLW